MLKEAKIKNIFPAKPTLEGAGVKLKRVFGFNEKEVVDPFLLLDHFGSDKPEDYQLGFPWHPHRGIETITYMINGEVKHEDSLGNKGTIKSGDIQWMTAGSGIIHQEMPQKYKGEMKGFQLWANLPKKDKMINPKYRDIQATQIPEVKISNAVTIKVIAGQINGVTGPVKDIIIRPLYFDVIIKPNGKFDFQLPMNQTSFIYVFEGEAQVGSKNAKTIAKENAALFDDGNDLKINATEKGSRFLLISGQPLKESIAWSGPIVMNTQAELDVAFKELRNNTFIKHK